MATQIIVAMIQNGGFKVSGGRIAEDTSRALTKLVCEAYESVLEAIILEGSKPSN